MKICSFFISASTLSCLCLLGLLCYFAELGCISCFLDLRLFLFLLLDYFTKTSMTFHGCSLGFFYLYFTMFGLMEVIHIWAWAHLQKNLPFLDCVEQVYQYILWVILLFFFIASFHWHYSIILKVDPRRYPRINHYLPAQWCCSIQEFPVGFATYCVKLHDFEEFAIWLIHFG